MIRYDIEAIDYIAKIADGGMRDAITLMDKCLAYSTDLTLENVEKALGLVDYYTMLNLNNSIFDKDTVGVIEIIDGVHSSGADLKQFISSYTEFVLDICKYDCCKDFKYLTMPATYEAELKKYSNSEYTVCMDLLKELVKLKAEIKWETSPKSTIIASLMLFVCREEK